MASDVEMFSLQPCPPVLGVEKWRYCAACVRASYRTTLRASSTSPRCPFLCSCSFLLSSAPEVPASYGALAAAAPVAVAAGAGARPPFSAAPLSAPCSLLLPPSCRSLLPLPPPFSPPPSSLVLHGNLF